MSARCARAVLRVALLLVATLAHAEAPGPIPFHVEAVYPHDTTAFTQGLLFHDGHLYESTGQRGRSELRKVEVETGRVLARRRLSARYFGEGLALVRGTLYQLTWTSGEGFIYALDDFAPVGRIRYQGEGWGLAFDGSLLWMSDGSHRLTRRAPFGFRSVGEPLAVHLNGRPVPQLNELEVVEGALYANVWQTDRVVRIDPASGAVTGWLDLAGLLTARERASADVLNGIAWDASRRRLLVTGKFWPKLFELRIDPP